MRSVSVEKLDEKRQTVETRADYQGVAMASKIVVGTDGSESAQKAVDRAIEFAGQSGGELHLVIAYKTSAAYAGGNSWFPLKAQESHDHAEEAVRNAADELLKDAASKAGGVKVETHAIHGAASDAITDYAKQIGADLIVVGSRGMHGVHRVLGSVPSSIAHNAPCDVMIVKTD